VMGGNVWAESGPETGNRFHFTAVVETSERRPAKELKPTALPGASSPMVAQGEWILLAEDNVMNQRLVNIMLTKAGFRVEVANNGKEVVEKFAAAPDRYRLIFMDVQMPEMDGLEATAAIRNIEARQGGKRIPIVAITANALKGDRERCLDAGMDDYLSKPVHLEGVYDILKKWVFSQ